EVLAAPVDVTAYDKVRRFVNQTRERFGQVDICVTNAGGPPSKAFAETTIEDWQAGVRLNLMRTLCFAREVRPERQKHRWGSSPAWWCFSPRSARATLRVCRLLSTEDLSREFARALSSADGRRRFPTM